MILLTILSLLIIRIALLFLNPHPLFGDEAQYWVWSQHLAWGYYSKPPLIAWVIHVCTMWGGHTEAMIRLPFVLAHGVTAWGIAQFLKENGYAHLKGEGVLVYFLLPGVFLSSQIASTDPLLLACWSCAMVMAARPACWKNTVALGLLWGVGLLAKYAMIWFILGFAATIVWQPHRVKHFALAFLIALLIISPNLYWNAQQHWVTWKHTSQNIGVWNVQKPFVNLCTFVGAQIAILGPVGSWIMSTQGWRFPKEPVLRLCWMLSIPLLCVIALEAVMSRAYGNWASPAFVGIVIMLMLLIKKEKIRNIMLLSNTVVGLLIVTFPMIISVMKIPPQYNPYERMYTGYELVQQMKLEHILPTQTPTVMVSDHRLITAQLTHLLRDLSIPVVRWNPYRENLDYFAMSTNLDDHKGLPVLFVGSECLSVDALKFIGIEKRRYHLSLRAPHKSFCVQLCERRSD